MEKQNIQECSEKEFNNIIAKGAEKFSEEITKWFIKTVQKKYPFIWKPSQLFDPSAKTIYIKWNHDINEELFELAIKEGVLKLGMPVTDGWHFSGKKADYKFYLDHMFYDIIFTNIWRLWKRKLIIKSWRTDWNDSSKGKYIDSEICFQKNWGFCDWTGHIVNVEALEHKKRQEHLITDLSQLKKCVGRKCKNEKDINGIFIVDEGNYCPKCFIRKEQGIDVKNEETDEEIREREAKEIKELSEKYRESIKKEVELELRKEIEEEIKKKYKL